jgi:hypothetical protein
MRKLLILAAVAAVSSACHNRSEDEVGAAPDQGDTTAVTHVIDSTRTGPPGTGGRPGNATVTEDSVGVDSALTNQETPGTPGATDTTSWTATPQDTLGPRDATVQDSTTVQGDSAMTNGTVPDTTAAQ